MDYICWLCPPQRQPPMDDDEVDVPLLNLTPDDSWRTALTHLEAQYQSRDQALAGTLKALAAQLETLSARVGDLERQIER